MEEKRIALLRQMLAPHRCKLHRLSAGLEKWETSAAALDEDIQTAAIGALVPKRVGTTAGHEQCASDHVPTGSRRTPGPCRSPTTSVRIQDGCSKEHFRCSGCGQLWQRRREGKLLLENSSPTMAARVQGTSERHSEAGKQDVHQTPARQQSLAAMAAAAGAHCARLGTVEPDEQRDGLPCGLCWPHTSA